MKPNITSYRKESASNGVRLNINHSCKDCDFQLSYTLTEDMIGKSEGYEAKLDTDILNCVMVLEHNLGTLAELIEKRNNIKKTIQN